MDAGFLGGRDDRFRFGFRIETGNVLRDRAGEQFDVLRQIADKTAEHVGRPLVECGAIEPYLAAERQPDADQRADQRRLARSAGSDHADAAAGLDRKGDVLDDHPLITRRHDADALDRQALRRALQQGLGVGRRHLLEQPGQAVPALARGDKALPVRDRQIDRRQRPRREDRAGDDDAAGRFLVDHEIGADRQHRRLQHHAQHFCHRTETAGDVARTLIAGEVFFVGLAPARVQPAGHAHRHQHFGIAAAGLGEVVALGRKPHRILRRLPGQELGDQGQRPG